MVTCACPDHREIAQVDERSIVKSLIEPRFVSASRCVASGAPEDEIGRAALSAFLRVHAYWPVAHLHDEKELRPVHPMSASCSIL